MIGESDSIIPTYIESTDSIAVFTWTLGPGSNPDRSRSHAIHLPGDLDPVNPPREVDSIWIKWIERG